jgi:hypothetical protein
MTSTNAAKLELSAIRFPAIGGNRPVATASEGGAPMIKARRSIDIAGYFFTNADIFFLSCSYNSLAGTNDIPASLVTFAS